MTTTGEGETGTTTGGGGIDGVVARADTREALRLPTISMEDAMTAR